MPIHRRRASRLAFMLACTVVESSLSSPVRLGRLASYYLELIQQEILGNVWMAGEVTATSTAT